MTDRELDAWVATNVMEMVESHYELAIPKFGSERYWCPKDDVRLATCQRLPHFSTDASADYLVLVKVRETWDAKQIAAFNEHLYRLWWPRWEARENRVYIAVDSARFLYEPGDYSKAAMAAIDGRASAIGKDAT